MKIFPNTSNIAVEKGIVFIDLLTLAQALDFSAVFTDALLYRMSHKFSIIGKK
jgi:hypothetical protein